MRTENNNFSASSLYPVNYLHGTHMVNAGIQSHFTKKKKFFIPDRCRQFPYLIVHIGGGEQVF